MHVKLAETEHVSSSTGLRSGASDTQGESDLQNVINYLRRSKEIVCVFSYYYNCDKASFYGFQNFWFFIAGRNRNIIAQARKAETTVTGYIFLKFVPFLSDSLVRVLYLAFFHSNWEITLLSLKSFTFDPSFFWIEISESTIL